jgi:tetratricopeptide (TPR) repeat protein/transcriptional regulator with XRE-family HTH domain
MPAVTDIIRKTHRTRIRFAMSVFAGELKRLREGKSLSQDELAAASGVATRTISDIERGVSLRPRPSTVRMLADALGLAGQELAEFLTAARAMAPDGRAVPGTAAEPGDRVVPRMLPRDIESFTGRESELARLADAASRGYGTAGVTGVYVVEGMGGVGKTALVLRAAHQVAAGFPDGQLFADLQGYTPGVSPLSPEDALRSLLRALGTPNERVPEELTERAAFYRSQLAGTRTLIVLDNAASPAQVEPLLPGTAGCLVLVTSRRALAGVDGAQVVTLDTPSHAEAVRLFCAAAGHGRVAADDPDVAEIVDLCGCLPLAIRILAARLARRQSLRTGDVLAELRQEHQRLARLADEDRNVAAAFELSFRHLPQAAQRVFESLGVVPGQDFDSYAAASLLAEAGTAAVQASLESLLDHHLLIQQTAGRYRFHDLVRVFARQKSRALDLDALDRLSDFYLYSAQQADRHLDRRFPAVAPQRHVPAPRVVPDVATSAQAQAWLTAELANLEAALRDAAGRGQRGFVIALSEALAEYLRVAGPWDLATDLHHLALDAAIETGDLAGQAAALLHIGVIERQSGKLTAAVGTFEQAASASSACGGRLALAGALVELGLTRRLTGELGPAIVNLTDALDIYAAEGSHFGQAGALRELGGVQRQAGQFDVAERSLTAAGDLYRKLEHRYGEASTLSYLGGVRLAIKAYEPACAALTAALDIYRDLDDPICQANCLMFLGKAHLDHGVLRSADDALTEAGELYGRLGDRRGQAGVLAFLGDTQRQAGRLEQAGQSLSQALRLFGEVHDPGGAAETMNYYAALALAEGAPREARHRHARALRLARTSSSPKDEADALEGIANAHRAEGTASAARRQYAKSLSLYETMGCDADAARVRAALTGLARAVP